MMVPSARHGKMVPRGQENTINIEAYLSASSPGPSPLGLFPAGQKLTPSWGKQRWPEAHPGCC